MSVYKQPKMVPVPESSGYPNDVKKTQTLKTRGTGAATKGLNYSSGAIDVSHSLSYRFLPSLKKPFPMGLKENELHRAF